VTFEARLVIVLLLLALWGTLGLLPWSAVAVIRRGRDVLPALPLAVGFACLAGLLVPLLGARDETGFFVSLALALVAGLAATLAGVAIARRL
jgi:hypothetical protein